MTMQSSAQIEALAAGWLARRDSGRFSLEDQAELDAWLAASTANRVAFIRLEAAWQQANRLKVLGTPDNSDPMPMPGEWRKSPYFTSGLNGATEAARVDSPERTDDVLPTPQVERRARLSRAGLYGALAASILCAAIVSTGWVQWRRGPVYQTEVGVAATVPMVDGSKVTLNTSSKIRVALSDSERRVDLDQGEAFFDVAKDLTRPFVVSVGELRVVAVGTKFSIRRDGEQLRVVVTEGRVRMEKRQGSREVTLAQISAGGVVHARGDDILIQEQPLARVEEALSWRSGFVVFHDTTLADAVAELNRYNSRKIVIQDPAIASLRISGHFRAANGEAFVRLIEAGLPIAADATSTQIVLRSE